MFVRNGSGIERFESLVARSQSGNALDRLAEMEKRYLKKCPGCNKPFWIDPEQMETSWFNGQPIGYKCPHKNCGGVVKLEVRQ